MIGGNVKVKKKKKCQSNVYLVEKVGLMLMINWIMCIETINIQMLRICAIRMGQDVSITLWKIYNNYRHRKLFHRIDTISSGFFLFV